MQRTEMILLALIILLGIGIRSPEVLGRNFLFGFDQGRDYLAVERIVTEKKPTLIGSEVGAGVAGLRGIFHGPYYFYSLVLPYLVFNGHPYGGLLLMFFFGVASLFLCFYFVKQIIDTKTALIATFLLAICPPIISQSRFIWNSHPTTPFILLAFWFTFKIFKSPFRYFFLATFFAGLIYGFELAVSVPLTVAIFFYVLVVLRIKDIRIYFSGLAGAFLAHLPFFMFELRHGFMATKGIIAAFSNMQGQKTAHLVFMKINLLNFWFNFKTTFLLGHWLSLLLFLTIIILAYHFLKEEKNKAIRNFIVFLVILPLVSLGVFMFLTNFVWDHYLIHLHLAYIFLFALFLSRIKLLLPKLLLSLMIVLMLPGLTQQVRNAYHDFYDYGGIAKIRGKLEAVDYLYKDADGEKFNVLVFTPPIYDYAYRYLLGWYGERKYGYVPGDEKKGVFYLWIEPDSGQPWTYKGWLETVVKEGEVLKEETLPSGFIIQKRDAKE